MTRLRKMMLEEFQRRNFAEADAAIDPPSACFDLA